MFHVVYVSSSTQLFTKSDLQTLLHKARDKNTQLDLTGMLLYKDGNFMQVLEGKEEVVTKLVEIIKRDTRHKGFLELLRGTSEQRMFPNWSMGYRDLSDKDVVKTLGYSDFMNTPLTGTEFSQDPNRCMKLLLLFKKNM
jgi:hypothetical protein